MTEIDLNVECLQVYTWLFLVVILWVITTWYGLLLGLCALGWTYGIIFSGDYFYFWLWYYL